MHNLEPQTIESINLLRKKKVPFIVALNKIDRLYQWKPNRHKDVKDVIENQEKNTKLEFIKRKNEVKVAMAEQGLNCELFYENPDPKTYISMVPTSAHSGEQVVTYVKRCEVSRQQCCCWKFFSQAEVTFPFSVRIMCIFNFKIYF